MSLKLPGLGKRRRCAKYTQPCVQHLHGVPITNQTITNFTKWRRNLNFTAMTPQQMSTYWEVMSILSERAKKHESNNKTAGKVPYAQLRVLLGPSFRFSEKSSLRPNQIGRQKAKAEQQDVENKEKKFQRISQSRFEKGRVRCPVEAHLVVKHFKNPNNTSQGVPKRRQQELLKRFDNYLADYLKNGNRKAVIYATIEFARVIVYFRPELLEEYLNAKFFRRLGNGTYESFKFNKSMAKQIRDSLKSQPTPHDIENMKKRIDVFLSNIETKIDTNGFVSRANLQDIFLPGLSFVSGGAQLTGTCMDDALLDYVLNGGRPVRVCGSSHFNVKNTKSETPTAENFVFLILMPFYRHYNNPESKSKPKLIDALHSILEHLLGKLTRNKANKMRVEALTRHNIQPRRSTRLTQDHPNLFQEPK